MYEKIYENSDGNKISIKYTDNGRLLNYTNLTELDVKLLNQDEFPWERKGNSNVSTELKFISLKGY